VGKLHQELQSIAQARPNRIQLRPMPRGRQWSPSGQTRSVSLFPECGRPSPVQSPPPRSDSMRLVRLGIVDTLVNVVVVVDVSLDGYTVCCLIRWVYDEFLRISV
jgi:hypothetical protein